MSFKFIDMFAGIGGFHVGLSRLGGEAVWACEINNSLADVYESNFKLRPAGDIKEVDYDSIPDHDVLCAGFPCQPFSMIRSQDRKGAEHEKGDLFSYILKVLQAKKPTFFILENVLGLKNINNGKTFTDILITLQREGYDIDYYDFCCQDFDIPQSRPRLFIIGSKKGITLRLLKKPKVEQTKDTENPLAKVKEADIKDQEFIQDTVTFKWMRFYRSFYLKFGYYPDFPKRLIAPEFRANYPYGEGISIDSFSIEELHKYRTTFGDPLKGETYEEISENLPAYLTADIVRDKRRENLYNNIRKSRLFYETHKDEIEPFLQLHLRVLSPGTCKSRYRFDARKIIDRFTDDYANLYGFFGTIRINYNYIYCLTTDIGSVPFWLKENRYFTINECLKTMGFNDGEVVLPNEAKMYGAIGNSVSPTIIEHLGNALINKKSTYLPAQHKYPFL